MKKVFFNTFYILFFNLFKAIVYFTKPKRENKYFPPSFSKVGNASLDLIFLFKVDWLIPNSKIISSLFKNSFCYLEYKISKNSF